MINRQYCPIISYQKQYQSGTECMEEACAFWDEKRGQCCIKSAALAVADKKPGGASSVPLQAEYVYPVSTTPAVIPGGSGDWVNPRPYTITCDLGEIVQ